VLAVETLVRDRIQKPSGFARHSILVSGAVLVGM
jgi:hypothetical protein